MTHGYCPYTTVAAVKAADRILGPNRDWRGRTAVQSGWLDRFYRPIVEELATVPEIRSNATYVPEEHVAFLLKHGWKADIESCPPGQFLTAAVFDLLVRWKTPGTSVPLKAKNRKMYPGAKLEEDVAFWELDIGGKTVRAACIATETADRVWLAATEDPGSQLETAHVAQIIATAPKRPVQCAYLHFPMVDLETRKPIDWIKGLSTVGSDKREWEIKEGVQKLTLKMNHIAAHARASDEMRVGITSLPPPALIIDKPFMAVFERPGLTHPLFAAYVTHDSWKDPGKIGEGSAP